MSTVPLFLIQSQHYLLSSHSAEPSGFDLLRQLESLGFAAVLGLFALAALVALAGA